MAERTCLVTGAASGIGAATTAWLRARGVQVITSDLHDADVIADLATKEGRAALADGAARCCDGRLDAVIANAGGGPPETSLQLNFFGAVATLEGLRPLMAASPAPRVVAISSIASLRPARPDVLAALMALDEEAALRAARAAWDAGELGGTRSDLVPDAAQAGLDLYGVAKQALQLWCRRMAPSADWAGAGIPLNVVALGFYETPAAAYVLSDPGHRAAVAKMTPLAGAFPGRPEEAAALLSWCVSPENSQMTGQILYADGGLECLAHAAAAPAKP